MSVLFNKYKTELIITCHCGCDEAVHVVIDKDDYDYYAIMSYMNGNFYKDQYGVFNIIKEKLKKILAIISNKDYYYSDIVMNKEDFLLFKDYVNSICIEE